MTPIMVMTPKKTLCLESREEAELARMAFIDAGESEVVIVEQLSMWDDADS
jgi:hypothetical protein